MARGIFISGTDTGVGKTIVSATLALVLRQRGVKVGVMKPVTSGCRLEDGRPVSDDARLLALAAGITCDDDVAPYLLHEALAPADAARMDGIRIDFERIRECYDRLSEIHDVVIVEGAGGLMVPLVGGLLVADLVKKLELPLLVVARPALGTINHTLLTCYAARQMGLSVSGVIISDYPAAPGAAEQSAPHQIGSLCGAPLLGIWPHFAGDDQEDVVDQLAVWLDGQPETAIVLRELGLWCETGGGRVQSKGSCIA